MPINNPITVLDGVGDFESVTDLVPCSFNVAADTVTLNAVKEDQNPDWEDGEDVLFFAEAGYQLAGPLSDDNAYRLVNRSGRSYQITTIQLQGAVLGITSTGDVGKQFAYSAKSQSIVYNLLLIYDINSPRQSGGSNLVLWPSSGLPAEAQRALDPADKDKLDNGTAGYLIRPLTKDPGMTTGDLAAKAQELHSQNYQNFAAKYHFETDLYGLTFPAS